MSSIAILFPKVAEDSAKLLADSLLANGHEIKLVNPYETDQRDFTKHDMVIKYGFSAKIKVKDGAHVINRSKSLKIAKDKLNTFDALKEAGITINYTTDKNVAKQWMQTDEYVVAREFSDGSNGAGITYCTDEAEIDTAPAKFWTRYLDHVEEFRINVWRDTVQSIYLKEVRNDHFKFHLKRGNEEHPQLVEFVKKVYDSLKLDWYGMDVLLDNEGKLHLLEVNSAPVLFPFTVRKLNIALNKELQND